MRYVRRMSLSAIIRDRERSSSLRAAHPFHSRSSPIQNSPYEVCTQPVIPAKAGIQRGRATGKRTGTEPEFIIRLCQPPPTRCRGSSPTRTFYDPFADSSAETMRPAFIGVSRKRMPMASLMALPTVGTGGTIGTSPTPRTP